MKKSDARKLEEYREELREAESKSSELKGERNVLTQRLGDDYNLKPEGIEKRLSKIEKEKEKKEGQFDSVMAELEEAFEEE